LSGLLDSPVIDATGIEGRFDFDLQVSAGDIPTTARGFSRANEDPDASVGLFGSLERIGLKLEGRRMPVQVLVVDRAEKDPTRN
jgi:uncharacterized protein (TIGR03435 family)